MRTRAVAEQPGRASSGPLREGERLSGLLPFGLLGLLLLTPEARVQADGPVALDGPVAQAQGSGGSRGGRPTAPARPVKPRVQPGAPGAVTMPGAVPVPRSGTVPRPVALPKGLEEARGLLETRPAEALSILSPLLVVLEPPQTWRPEALELAGQALWRLKLHALAVEQWRLGLALSAGSGATAGASGPERALRVYQTLLTEQWPLAKPPGSRGEHSVWMAPRVRLLRQEAARLLEVSKLPLEHQGEALYDRGLGLAEAGEPMQAVRALATIPPDHPRFVTARLNMAVFLTQVRRRAPAVAVLEDLLQNHSPRAQADGLLERVRLNLARARYGLGQVEEARVLYEGIPRGSPLWLDAQQELAWVWYRTFAEREDLVALNRALGTLHTLNSPFFAHLWQPEARLMEAQILFQLCRFVDGSARLKGARQTLTQARDTLKQLLAGTLTRDAVLLEEGRSWRAAGAPPETLGFPPGMLAPWLALPEWSGLAQDEALFAQTEAALSALGDGLERGLRAQLGAWLSRAREVRAAEAARALRNHLSSTRDALDGYLRQAALFEVDFLTAEKELYEAAAAGRVPFRTRRAALRKAASLREGRVWPYEGEVWADELGYYRGIAQPECPE